MYLERAIIQVIRPKFSPTIYISVHFNVKIENALDFAQF